MKYEEVKGVNVEVKGVDKNYGKGDFPLDRLFFLNLVIIYDICISSVNYILTKLRFINFGRRNR